MHKYLEKLLANKIRYIGRYINMKWFYNMKIGTKLLLSFVLVAMFSAAIGFVAITRLNMLQ